jgi:hypothetical protein
MCFIFGKLDLSFIFKPIKKNPYIQHKKHLKTPFSYNSTKKLPKTAPQYHRQQNSKS